ncbi:hypothetical protein COY89_04360 [Candidatus Roizmanbacteria bacterium CG_4_10_14_0_8_um_filter_36_36]|uniref:HTH dtxR-type domain-containing protein n=1 Tax=Candidatus Roizmanbacteria bacterium CG_4_8_14_3_um_filter_36_10 TaxID=1974834 RepID=A0A2M8GM12_9BACT|nr:MAG: hypothetical protein COY89_04360 [Candidatus Roizmanbacteria bacterium CG_4_10_14_0_8_um_filter_36_36]PJC81568.1 MAG: hypothetical protein CO007_04015 [Candidatus Roizmanbacteria bacterium CG_4_8_14_3_um_filter_36_10]
MHNQSQEDYLRAIFSLVEKKGSNDVKSIEVATYLNVSKPAVSKMIKKLYQKKFIETRPYSNISLTKKGLKKTKILVYKHRIIEVFLVKTLGINKGRVHEEAHRLEHAFSDNAVYKLAKFLGNPRLCPDNQKIPNITIS